MHYTTLGIDEREAFSKLKDAPRARKRIKKSFLICEFHAKHCTRIYCENLLDIVMYEMHLQGKSLTMQQMFRSLQRLVSPMEMNLR